MNKGQILVRNISSVDVTVQSAIIPAIVINTIRHFGKSSKENLAFNEGVL
jgi:hypothetical protein